MERRYSRPIKQSSPVTLSHSPNSGIDLDQLLHLLELPGSGRMRTMACIG